MDFDSEVGCCELPGEVFARAGQLYQVLISMSLSFLGVHENIMVLLFCNDESVCKARGSDLRVHFKVPRN
ncbi:hypothetical protein RchiOBHm_Chr5g0077251 [Rosa chinensis]|uniref:Uncharacterized protein n=1 Tax=Rosa chinensis TaxID=74649 RepID=A0A2P6QLZ9_ROSCH|nr:hypothetical protein RchiOBHm_Chr5g0077251 [Rosa chinensis]